jgi:hypothetical protein
MDPGMVRAVVDWPQPMSRVQLQRFLASPCLHSPLPRFRSCGPQLLTGGSLDLKHSFTTVPILVPPDPSRQLVVEADASDVGVGADLSQRSALVLKLHP